MVDNLRVYVYNLHLVHSCKNRLEKKVCMGENLKKAEIFLVICIKKLKVSYIYRIAAGGFVAAFLMATLTTSFVSALGGQVQTRQIELSNSAISATGVNYSVSFYPTATTVVGGIVIDFCANDPIIGDTC